MYHKGDSSSVEAHMASTNDIAFRRTIIRVGRRKENRKSQVAIARKQCIVAEKNGRIFERFTASLTGAFVLVWKFEKKWFQEVTFEHDE